MQLKKLNYSKLDLNKYFDIYICDYCNTNIKKNWYYCFHCHKDMCNLCYSEINEEIAIKNGARFFKKREKKIIESTFYQ